MLEETKKAHKKVINLLEKNKDLIAKTIDIPQIRRGMECYEFRLKLTETCGIKIPDWCHICNTDYFKIDEYLSVSQWGHGSRRKISCPDDGKQPKELQHLFVISFSCGAYIFGDDYPVDLFHEMFLELKGYGADYVDSANKSLYFKLENAGEVSHAFEEIYAKYQLRYKKEASMRKREKLLKELEELEANVGSH